LNASNAPIKTFAYTYDAVGHLLTSTNPDSKYTYTYDAVDRFTSVDNTGTAGVPAVKFNYGYDAVGNLLTVNDSINGANAGITVYTSDLLNRTTNLTQSGTGVSNKRVDMAYDAANRLTGISRFSDLAGTSAIAETNYAYDNNQRLIQLSHKKGASTIANYDYSYDNADKLAATVSSVDGTSNYSYDSTNQLTGTDHSSQTDEAYSYDANGNRTNGGYQTGTNNQLLADSQYTYQYDQEGNRTQRTEIATGKITEYVWDYRNRLTGVLLSDALGVVSKTIEYTYDVDDRRIGKKIDGAVTERYVYDGLHIALAFDGAGNQTHRYLYGTEVDQILADETPTRVLWALTDRLGSVKDLVDENGVILNHINYDSFGRVVSQTDASVEFRYGYTGREQDAETGLNYYRARYYDASNGRFISEDPLGFGAGDSNIYRYVGNSPVNGTDPSGEQLKLPPVQSPFKFKPPVFEPLPGRDPIVPRPIFDPQRPIIEPDRYQPGIQPIQPLPNSTLDYKKPFGELPSTQKRNLPKLKDRTVPLVLPEVEVEEVADPNKCEEEEKIKKCVENGGRVLYRGDTRNPLPTNPVVPRDGVFIQGFKSWNRTMKDLFRYAEFNEKSIYVGTSKEYETARYFATKDLKKNDDKGSVTLSPGKVLMSTRNLPNRDLKPDLAIKKK
jgi:RHS repeat-associated protein